MIISIAIATMAAWLAVLTLVVLGISRQLALLDVVHTAMASEQVRHAMDADGPELGSSLASDVIHLLREAEVVLPDQGCLTFLAATCAPCRELAEDLVADRYPYRDVTFVVPGRREAAKEIAALVRPLEAPVVLNPQAHDIMRLLNIHGSPFVVWFRRGQVVSTLFGRSPTDVRLALRQWHEHQVA